MNDSAAGTAQLGHMGSTWNHDRPQLKYLHSAKKPMAVVQKAQTTALFLLFSRYNPVFAVAKAYASKKTAIHGWM